MMPLVKSDFGHSQKVDGDETAAAQGAVGTDAHDLPLPAATLLKKEAHTKGRDAIRLGQRA